MLWHGKRLHCLHVYIRVDGVRVDTPFCIVKKNLKISTPFNTNTGLFPALVIQNMVISGNHVSSWPRNQELRSASVGY